MRAGWVLVAVLLAGCGGGGADWAKPGTDTAEVERAYQDCRAAAATAVRTDADIDQDILATRQQDWRRAGTGRLQGRTMQEHTRHRAAAIVASCMRAKGFAQAP